MVIAWRLVIPTRRELLAAAALAPALAPLDRTAAQEATPEATFERGVVYGEVDGQDLLLDVAQPPRRDEPRPAMIVIHGGFLVVGERGDVVLITAPLARAGYVAFSIDYRLFSNATGANPWPAQLDDAQRAVRWVRANAATYGVDPERVGAIGHSAGGQLASMLGVRETRDGSDPELAGYSSRVSCVVALAAYVDLSIPYLYPDITKLTSNILGGWPESAPDQAAYRDFSAITFVDEETAPFLLFHGARDDLVPVEHSRRMADKLHEEGVECVYAEFPDVEHFGIATWNLIGPLTLAFLDRHLG